MDASSETPLCWMCGSRDVRVVFKRYSRFYCKRGCPEDHQHFEDIPDFTMTCRTCGNVWDEPGEEYLPIAENVGS